MTFMIVFDPETCRRAHVESLRPKGSLASAEPNGVNKYVTEFMNRGT